MKRTLSLLFLLVFILTPYVYASNYYGCTSLSGGGTGALDALDITASTAPNADNLAEGDGATVSTISGTTVVSYFYIFDASGTSAESSPTVIRPDDYASAGNWLLSQVYTTALTVTGTATIGTLSVTNYGLEAGDIPDLSSTYQAVDADVTSIAGGVTGMVKGGGNGNGYSAATVGSDYVGPIETPTAFGFNDETPSVANHFNFVTANAATPSTITQFDGMTAGQLFTVSIGDASTTIDFTQANLIGNNEVSYSSTNGDFLICYSVDGTVAKCIISDPTAWQPLEATLTDIADGTITENLVNTANPWADNEVSDTLTASVIVGAEDGGTEVEVIDMSVTAGAADNTVESYTFKIDNIPIFTISAQSDGAGSVDQFKTYIEAFQAEHAKLEFWPDQGDTEKWRLVANDNGAFD